MQPLVFGYKGVKFLTEQFPGGGCRFFWFLVSFLIFFLGLYIMAWL